MIYRLVHELAADSIDVAVAGRVLRVSPSGSYEWRDRAPSARQVADEQLTATSTEVHAASCSSYGAPRGHAELRLGPGLACGRKRVTRLMPTAGLAGAAIGANTVVPARRRRCTRTWCSGGLVPGASDGRGGWET